MKIKPKGSVSSLYSEGYLEAEIHTAFTEAMLAVANKLEVDQFENNPFESGTVIELSGSSPIQPFVLFNKATEATLEDVIASFKSPLEPTKTRTAVGKLPGRFESEWLSLNRNQPLYIAISPLGSRGNTDHMFIETARNTLDSSGKVINRESVYKSDLSKTGWVLVFDASNMLNSIRVVNKSDGECVMLYSIVGEIE